MNLEVLKILSRCRPTARTSFCDSYAFIDKQEHEASHIFIMHQDKTLIFSWYRPANGHSYHNDSGPAKITKDLNTFKTIREDYYLQGIWVSYSMWVIRHSARNQ